MSGVGKIGRAVGRSERRADPIPVACVCGQRHQVPASAAGRKIRCGACGATVRVPKDDSLTSSEAARILDEVGIDAGAREHYERGVECFHCYAELTRGEVEAQAPGAHPVCSSCRAAAARVAERVAARAQAEEQAQQVREAREAHAAGAGARARAEAAESRRVPATSRRGRGLRSEEEARRKALRYALLFLVGISGLLATCGLDLVASLACGVAVSVGGGYHVYRALLRG